jgi:hypothetical protein
VVGHSLIRLSGVHTLQPEFTPKRRELPRTIYPTSGIFTVTDNSLKHDAWLLHFEHLASGFLYEPYHIALDSGDPAAVLGHLIGIKAHTSVLAAKSESAFNLCLRFDPNPLTRFKI